MFSEMYIEPKKGRKEKKSFFQFNKKKNIKKEKVKISKKNTSIDEAIDTRTDIPKKKRSSTFYGLVLFSVFILVIAGLKTWKQYRIDSEKEISKIEKKQFSKQLKVSPLVQKNKENESKTNEKRILGSFLISQSLSVSLEEKGIKFLISGIAYGTNETFYKQFYISNIQTNTDTKDIDKLKFIFTIKDKNNKIIKNIAIAFKDAYKLNYYYESVELEPLNNPSLKTNMKFVGDTIKKDFIFQNFEANKGYALYTFKILGNQYIKKIALDKLN